jgi:hypothetical protein
MMRYTNEISPEEAREYGLEDHSLTSGIDMRNPVLQDMFIKTSRRIDEKASDVRHDMGIITRRLHRIHK